MRKLRSAAVSAVVMGTLVGAAAEGDDAFTLGGCASVDLASGYVLYGARENDEPCLWSYAELCAGSRRWGSLVVGVWQNSDLTARRQDVMRRVNEWDWSVAYRLGVDLCDGVRANLEAGHIWYVYGGVKGDFAASYHTMGEWCGKAALENGIATPYVECYYDHLVYNGLMLLGGLRRSFELPLGLSLLIDLSAGGGDRNYNACLYPPFDGSVPAGVTFAQLSGTLTYWFTENLGAHAKVAYAVLTDESVRQAVRELDDSYATEHLWGTVGVEVAF